MTEFYKLVFDLALYTTLSGYFLRLTAREAPSGVLFLALCAAVALDAFFRTRALRRGALRYLPLLLPLLGLLARPTLWQCVQAVPDTNTVPDSAVFRKSAFKSLVFFAFNVP